MSVPEQPGVEWSAVRCIICNRIKQPAGRGIPMDLEGMRCDPSCPGYTMDPLPASHDPLLERLQPASVIGTPSVAATGLSQEPIDVIGRALIKTHFGV